MIHKKKWEELKKLHNVMISKLHLTPLPVNRKKLSHDATPYVYQYRTLESFWSILESDSFWATNARFSNDQEEQKLGMKKIREVLGDDADFVDTIEDCYIVCFCDEDDKLSQWRGYAPEGVAIGFDFNNIRPFYIKRKESNTYRCVYNSCYKVQYINEKTHINEFVDKFDLDSSDDKYNHEKIKHQAGNIIPYVKHIGFYEEAESRLVFSNEEAYLSDCIHYRDVGNIKIPYIIVKAGDEDNNKKNRCVIRLNFDAITGKELKSELISLFKIKKIKNVEIINCLDLDEEQADDNLCFGCTLREQYIPGVNGKKPKCRYACEQEDSFRIDIRNEIYISDSKNQKFIYDVISSFLNNDGKKYSVKQCKVRIWCDGHLPIRSITVGNLRNKEIVAESIRHYCSKHYWLQSVEVKSSDTPYRSSLI